MVGLALASELLDRRTKRTRALQCDLLELAAWRRRVNHLSVSFLRLFERISLATNLHRGVHWLLLSLSLSVVRKHGERTFSEALKLFCFARTLAFKQLTNTAFSWRGRPAGS